MPPGVQGSSQGRRSEGRAWARSNVGTNERRAVYMFKNKIVLMIKDAL